MGTIESGNIAKKIVPAQSGLEVGFRTAIYRRKQKIVEKLYGIEIIEQ